jgi:CheY-like chemotaxis protein
MDKATGARVIGILNSTEDVIDLLEAALQGEGYATVAAYIPDFKRGRADLAAWLDRLAPTAILYDIPPPYEENWTFYQQMLGLEAARKHRFVVTTTNLARLEEIAGPVAAVELVGKPFDLEDILGRVATALEALDRGERQPLLH